MKDEMDDYLWDGTGEVDADVERLEGLLGRYRSTAPAPELPAASPRLAFFPAVLRRAPQLGAAIAATLAIAVGLATWSSMRLGAGRTPVENPIPHVDVPGGTPPEGSGPAVGPPKIDTPPTPTSQGGGDSAANSYQHKPGGARPHVVEFVGVADRAPRTPRVAPPRPSDATAVPSTAPNGSGDIAATEPIRRSTKRFIDVQTAEHLEQAALLLRTFRNDPVDATTPDNLAYAKRRSRELLDQNVLLRRSAEARGNLPAEDVLNSLEPYLLDIANLGDKPARSDVSAIRTRIEKKEIVDDLQLYAMNGPRLGF